MCRICERMNKFIILYQTSKRIAVLDEYPVSDWHTLLIPKKHFNTYFDLPKSYTQSIDWVLKNIKEILDNKFHPSGYNIGFNCGETAGQSIMHFHIHIIPRYKGDVENPRGGIRGIIPNKQNYHIQDSKL